MSKFIDRTGETRVMKNSGLSATIIRYRNNEDIDIMFDNGVIVLNRVYANFKKEKIICPMAISISGDCATVTNFNTSIPTIFIMDAEDLPLLGNSLWHKNDNGYIVNRNKNIGTIRLHRLIISAPDNMLVDHINGNTVDNRKSNLRLCSHIENLRNSKVQSNNKTGYKGVYWHTRNKKWIAHITIKRKSIHLGVFSTKEDAARAYNEAAIKYFGEFARLNNI